MITIKDILIPIFFGSLIGLLMISMLEYGKYTEEQKLFGPGEMMEARAYQRQCLDARGKVTISPIGGAINIKCSTKGKD